MVGAVDAQRKLDFDVAPHVGVRVDREFADRRKAGRSFQANEEVMKLGVRALPAHFDGQLLGTAQRRRDQVAGRDLLHPGGAGVPRRAG